MSAEKCCSTEGSCATTTASQECCPVEKAVSDCSCPVEKGIKLWQSAFFQAMRTAQVEILKEKIRKAWGSHLDKEADAILEAMGAAWQSIMAQGKAQANLKEAFKKIYESMK